MFRIKDSPFHSELPNSFFLNVSGSGLASASYAHAGNFGHDLVARIGEKILRALMLGVLRFSLVFFLRIRNSTVRPFLRHLEGNIFIPVDFPRSASVTTLADSVLTFR